jgi:hypothetical protein
MPALGIEAASFLKLDSNKKREELKIGRLLRPSSSQ